MKIKKGMILAAGLGTRMMPLTKKTPKPLIKIGKKNLLERGIELLINHGVEEIVVNIHYLGAQIQEYISNKNYNVRISISSEENELLDTGGGILNGTKIFHNDPFIVLNPDTVWNQNYISELKLLERFYLNHNKPCLLVVEKKLSFDRSFKGDFSLDAKNFISREVNNQYIFTGLQILDSSVFNLIKKKIFSMNKVWDNLINLNNLKGLKSNEIFYHLNTKAMHDKIVKLKSID
jgi:MurNAc alpha-1-phosphate uridylyltransferase